MKQRLKNLVFGTCEGGREGEISTVLYASNMFDMSRAGKNLAHYSQKNRILSWIKYYASFFQLVPYLLNLIQVFLD